MKGGSFPMTSLNCFFLNSFGALSALFIHRLDLFVLCQVRLPVQASQAAHVYANRTASTLLERCSTSFRAAESSGAPYTWNSDLLLTSLATLARFVNYLLQPQLHHCKNGMLVIPTSHSCGIWEFCILIHTMALTDMAVWHGNLTSSCVCFSSCSIVNGGFVLGVL